MTMTMTMTTNMYPTKFQSSGPVGVSDPTKATVIWSSGERCWLNSLDSHCVATVCRDEYKVLLGESHRASVDRKRKLPL